MTGREQLDAWSAGVLPGVEQVAADVWSVPVPIPDNPLRYVNCYVLTTPDGPVLVDPGWPARASWDALVAGLAAADCTPADVRGVLVSHAHSDHHGLAERVRKASGCWVGMHPAEAAVLASMRDGSAVRERNESWPDACGIPADERGSLAFDDRLVRRISALAPDVLIEGGAVVEVPSLRLEALWTPGHTPGHLCFRLADEGLVLTGDHLLPRITAHVGSYQVEADVLATYLASLRSLEEWGAGLDAEVLPGHEYRFRGLSARVKAVLDHHAERLREVVELVSDLGAPTTWEVAVHLTWSRSWGETTGNRRRMAVAETLAHLAHAEATGRVARLPGVPVYWESIPNRS